MRTLRTLLFFSLALMVALPLLGCNQHPAAKKAPTPIFDAKKADWARIDLQDNNAPVQGFIDTKTYKPLPAVKANFWHKLATEKETVITHLLLDCQGKKYLTLAQLAYDGKGNLTSQTTAKAPWKAIVPKSNAALLCMTLDPTGEGFIQKEDLPIIRNLLLSGMKNVKKKK